MNLNEIAQNLYLGSEPDANYSIAWEKTPDQQWTNRNRKEIIPTETGLASGGEFNGSQSGKVVTVTYTNLKNSYYVDANGQKHNIAKMVHVFSNLIANGNNSNKVILQFMNNPYYNFDMVYGSSVDEQVFFYDENNQLVKFPNDTAWLILSSLNHNVQRDGSQHTETVKILNNGKLYQQATNPDATIHSDGSAYEDKMDSELSHVLTDGGTVFGKIENGATIQWCLRGIRTGLQNPNYNWYYTQLGTAFDNLTVSTPKPVELHYHYNVYFKLP